MTLGQTQVEPTAAGSVCLRKREVFSYVPGCTGKPVLAGWETQDGRFLITRKWVVLLNGDVALQPFMRGQQPWAIFCLDREDAEEFRAAGLTAPAAHFTARAAAVAALCRADLI